MVTIDRETVMSVEASIAGYEMCEQIVQRLVHAALDERERPSFAIIDVDEIVESVMRERKKERESCG